MPQTDGGHRHGREILSGSAADWLQLDPASQEVLSRLTDFASVVWGGHGCPKCERPAASWIPCSIYQLITLQPAISLTTALFGPPFWLYSDDVITNTNTDIRGSSTNKASDLLHSRVGRTHSEAARIIDLDYMLPVVAA